MARSFQVRCTGCGGLFVFIALSLTVSCAHLHLEPAAARSPELPISSTIPSVPFFPQRTHQCGPTALAMVLSWSEAHVGPHELLPEVYTPQQHGSLQAALVSAARRRNRLAYEIQGVNALLCEIAAGHPVIVLQNVGLGWFPRWHYAVVIGYDLQKEIVVLHSGKEEGRHVPWSLFMRTWERADAWGLLVLPPGYLPASADERSYLMAVLGLEQTEQWDGACQAYSAALEQWENSLGALMGLGNCRYALGDLTGAEKAFRRAVEMNPKAGSAYNNLAHVLAEQKRYSEAIEMSNRAQALGGPNNSLYWQTLREIRRSQTEER